MHMCVRACAHAWGSPQPPYPHKKFEGPNPIGSQDMAHYVIGCKTSNFHESLGVVVGGSGARPPLPPPLNFNLTLSQKSQVVV